MQTLVFNFHNMDDSIRFWTASIAHGATPTNCAGIRRPGSTDLETNIVVQGNPTVMPVLIRKAQTFGSFGGCKEAPCQSSK